MRGEGGGGWKTPILVRNISQVIFTYESGNLPVLFVPNIFFLFFTCSMHKNPLNMQEMALKRFYFSKFPGEARVRVCKRRNLFIGVQLSFRLKTFFQQLQVW